MAIMELSFEPGTYELCRNGPGTLLIRNLGPGTISFPDAGVAGSLRPEECALIVDFKYLHVAEAAVKLHVQT